MNSEISEARYQFYKKHPEVAVVEANDQIIESWATDNVLSLEKLNTWEIASNALDGRLAKNTTRLEIQPESPQAAPAVTPEPSLKEMSVDQLREIVKSQRVDFTPQLPASYTPERIRKMPAEELRQLQTKYGSATLNKRLAGR